MTEKLELPYDISVQLITHLSPPYGDDTLQCVVENCIAIAAKLNEVIDVQNRLIESIEGILRG